MKFGIFVHPKRPKVSTQQIATHVESAGLEYSADEPDIAIVVGGDGTFAYFGKLLTLPMLFVGIKEADVLGSKARLAEIMLDSLDNALHEIDAGRYRVIEKRMLSAVLCNQQSDVLTDVYLERGEFAGCIRYIVKVNNNNNNGNEQLSFIEHAIGNGVIISTSFGSGGYFSYPGRIKSKEWDRYSSIDQFSDDRLGICHILPTHLVHEKSSQCSLTDRIQYTVPIESKIEIKLVRQANVRLYGTTEDSKGKPVMLSDTISISGSKRIAKIIKLKA